MRDHNLNLFRLGQRPIVNENPFSLCFESYREMSYAAKHKQRRNFDLLKKIVLGAKCSRILQENCLAKSFSFYST